MLDSQKKHNDNLKFNLKIDPATWVIIGQPYTLVFLGILFYNCFPVLFLHLVSDLFRSQLWSDIEHFS